MYNDFASVVKILIEERKHKLKRLESPLWRTLEGLSEVDAEIKIKQLRLAIKDGEGYLIKKTD